MPVAAPMASPLSAMTTDDSMSDDVFESPEDTLASQATTTTATKPVYAVSVDGIGSRTTMAPPNSAQQLKTPSPTGYRDYKPPAELLRVYEQPQEEVEQMVHKTILLGDSGVGKTSLLVQFDTGKFQTGTFSATVGIGFTVAMEEVQEQHHQVRRVVSRPSWCSQQSPTANGSSSATPPRRDSGTFRSIPATPVQQIQSRPADQCELTCKVMLLGDSGVGKTCLLVRFRDGLFLSGNFISTVGIDFRNKVVMVDQSKVKLQIWDTAGQERFRSVTHAYYRDAHALLLLYDVTNKISFDNIRAWLGEIREYAQDDVVIMLLGNKADCGSERLVRKEDGERLSREYNVAFMETSAKTGLNVELAFMAVARELKSRKSGNPDENKFNVQEYVREQTQRGSCPPCNT